MSVHKNRICVLKPKRGSSYVIRYRRLAECRQIHTFNAITQAGAESANYPFCTIEPNVGIVAVPNVIVSSHQAFLTNEALENIAEVTLENLATFFDDKKLENEICYQCQTNAEHCKRKENGRCF